MKILTFIALIFAGALVQAQTIIATTSPVPRMANAFPICNEGCTITAMPVGTVWQFGKDETKYGQTNTWLPQQTSTAAYPKLPFFVYYTDWPVNPTPETKELDVQQTSAPQTIVYTLPCSPSPCTNAPVTVIVPTLAATTPVTTPAVTNACSTNNVSCTNATNSDAAHIITPAGDVSLNPTETATLKSAIQALQAAQGQVVTAQAALQAVQQTIAINHGASASGPYQISTDFDTTIEQVPPVPTTSAQ